MGKILLGFIVGIAVASSVFMLFNVAEQDTLEVEYAEVQTPAVSSNPRVPGADEGNLRSAPAAIGQPTQISQGEAAVRQIAEPAASSELPATLPHDEELRLQREIEEAQLALNQAIAAMQEIERAKILDDPVVVGIPLRPEFDWVSESPNLNAMHELIQREYVDEAWAGPAEAQLLSYLYDHPELVQKYGSPEIHCRATRCQVTLVGYGIYEDGAADFNTLLSDFRDHPGATLFDFSFGSTGTVWGHNSQDGVTTIFLSVKRSEE